MRLFSNGCIVPEVNDSNIYSMPRSFCWKPVKDIKNGPIQRFQHAACIINNCVFMYGGRGIYGTLNDLWKYDSNDETWCVIDANGDKPPPLEGQSIVAYDGQLYMFGGEMSFASAGEVPLWMFNQKLCLWKKIKGSNQLPTGRREHTAVVYQNQMCVYGGYIDLKGPTGEMWMYDFEETEWVSVNSALVGNCPVARYKHAAVVHEDLLWVCGGLMGVTNRNETQVWTWNFIRNQWCHIRTRNAPLQLFNHDICLMEDQVFVFGGNQEDGKPCSRLWRVSLRDLSKTRVQSWQQCRYQNKVAPSPSSNHCIIALPRKQFSSATICANIPEVSDSMSKQDILYKNDNKLKNDAETLNGIITTSPKATNCLIEVEPYNARVSLPKHEIAIAPLEKNVWDSGKYIETSCEYEWSYDNQGNDHVTDTNDQCLLIPSGGTCNFIPTIKEKKCIDESFDIFDDPALMNSSTENLCLVKNDTLSNFNKLKVRNHSKRNKISEHFNELCSSYDNPSYIPVVSPAICENEKVKQFSYNLSRNTEKTWQPVVKTSKFQTTSFSEIQPSKVQKRNSDFANISVSHDSIKDFVKFSKQGENENVTLPTNHFSYSRLSNELENTVVKKPTFQEEIPKEACLLLLGGKQTNSHVFTKQSISAWKCTINY